MTTATPSTNQMLTSDVMKHFHNLDVSLYIIHSWDSEVFLPDMTVYRGNA